MKRKNITEIVKEEHGRREPIILKPMNILTL